MRPDETRSAHFLDRGLARDSRDDALASPAGEAAVADLAHIAGMDVAPDEILTEV